MTTLVLAAAIQHSQFKQLYAHTTTKFLTKNNYLFKHWHIIPRFNQPFVLSYTACSQKLTICSHSYSILRCNQLFLRTVSHKNQLSVQNWHIIPRFNQPSVPNDAAYSQKSTNCSHSYSIPLCNQPFVPHDAACSKNGQFVVIYCKYIKKQSYRMHFNKAGGVMLNENK